MADEVRISSYGIAKRIWTIYLKEVDKTFEMEGPGWFPLSKLTLWLKNFRNSTFIDNILMEYSNMRQFIELMDETDNRKVRFSVGLFKDGKAAMNPERVDWAVKHEFGGWEVQGNTVNEEIITGKVRLEKDVLARDDDLGTVNQRKLAGGDITVYIPQRSFLGKTFDRVQSDLINEIIRRFRNWMSTYRV